WDYCDRSAAFVFGRKLGDSTAERLLEALRERSPSGMSRTEIRDHFARNKDAAETDAALELLLEHGLAEGPKIRETGGRPAEIFSAAPTTNTTEATGRSVLPTLSSFSSSITSDSKGGSPLNESLGGTDFDD